MKQSAPKELVEAWLADELSESQSAGLAEWLRENPENRRQFVEVNVRDQQLRAIARAEAGLGTLSEVPRTRILRFPRRVWIPAAMAAALAVLFGISPLLKGQRDRVATVQSTRKLNAFGVGDSLHAGELVRLEMGRMAIRFDSGARLAVTGPAEFRIIGPNAASLVRGQATVRVPGRIKGFALDTPTKRVIDLGTAFGVNVDQSGKTAIAVFEGEVTVGEGRHLFAGEAVEFARPLSAPHEIPYAEGRFSETWQVSFGVETLAGRVRLAAPSERPMPGRVRDGDSLLLFPEREDVTIPSDFVVNATGPGTHRRPFRRHRQPLNMGVKVDSFLLQYHPATSGLPPEKRRFEGELQFDRPIVGLVLDHELLAASDRLLGLPGADFGGVFRRGVNTNDEVSLTPDRRTLAVSFDVLDGVDQIRVLVASHPDSNPIQ